ncbi:hypothetical protein V6Z11_A03G074100 [Gossypium hirsutum]
MYQASASPNFGSQRAWIKVLESTAFGFTLLDLVSCRSLKTSAILSYSKQLTAPGIIFLPFLTRMSSIELKIFQEGGLTLNPFMSLFSKLPTSPVKFDIFR